MSGHPAYEAVIGLEVHCQLATDSKIFCACPARTAGSVADFGNNANACPICAGHPGTLPVMNRKVVEYAIKAGLATGCTINPSNVFARKNYFYPDLPKGYQISQYDQPICEHGCSSIETHGQAAAKKIRIQRIHMEEDAGKNVHGLLPRQPEPRRGAPDRDRERAGSAIGRGSRRLSAYSARDRHRARHLRRQYAERQLPLRRQRERPAGRRGEARHPRGDQERELLPLRREGHRLRDRAPDRAAPRGRQGGTGDAHL